MHTDPSEGQQTLCWCPSSSSPCMTQSPNTGCLSPSLRHLQDCLQPDRVTVLLRGVGLDAATLRLLLGRAPPSHLSLATPLDLPRSAHLSPLASDLAAYPVPQLGRRRLHDHSSLVDGAVPLLLAERYTRLSTSSRPLFSVGRRRRLALQTSTPLPRLRCLDTLAAAFTNLFLRPDDVSRLPRNVPPRLSTHPPLLPHSGRRRFGLQRRSLGPTARRLKIFCNFCLGSDLRIWV